MKDMSTQGLLERSNGYYFQARIPKQYRQHYPREVIREKLPTDNRKEAIALVRMNRPGCIRYFLASYLRLIGVLNEQ
ncbi:hypothetical protein Q9292_09795, partial [Methylophilus sp. VKM B-3414]|uniref:DUF6538 domain-containing protein n=1 Tax=Methylophilus sp. VKM B-3414 TaxID=3076121 RepID=UPI0028C54B64|nr:hypothetical protein [Methylophilus sp. VKM B-3414]